MAVSIENSTFGPSEHSDTITISNFIIASDDNGVLVVVVPAEELGNVSVTGITWNTNEDLTQVIRAVHGTPYNMVEIWYLEGPTATTADIVVTFDQEADDAGYGVYSLHGCDPEVSIPTDSSTGSSTNNINATVNVTSAGSLIIDGLSCGAFTNVTADETDTKDWEEDVGGTATHAGGHTDAAGTGNKVVGYDLSTSPNRTVLAAAAFAPAAAGSTRALAGTIAAVGAVTASSLLRLRTLPGSLAAVSSLSSALNRSRLMSGVFAAVSTLAGALSRSKLMSGAMATVSSLSGTMYRSRIVIGSFAAVSTVAGALTKAVAVGTKLLAGTIAAVSSIAAQPLKRSKLATGSIAAVSSLAGSISRLRIVQTTVAAVSSFVGDLTRTVVGTAVWNNLILEGINTASGKFVQIVGRFKRRGADFFSFARLETDRVSARSGAGLGLYDDGGNGIFVADGGQVSIGDGTNETVIETDGTIKLEGDATVWDDLRVPATNTKLTPSKSEPNFESLINGLYVYKFDTTNADDESIHFVAQMPHKYKAGSDIYPHIHWCPDSTNGGNVYWSFEYTVADLNDTIGASTTDDIVVAADGTSLKHQVDSFSTIDGTGLTISHMIICRLTRKSTSEATDTFTGNACFLEFDFHYEIDTMGSRQEFTK